jgi:hypothetical protein
VNITINAPTGLFPPSALPAVASVADYSPIELGMKFSSSVAGNVTGVRFYKGVGNSGVHVGSLWTVDGQRLASATFTSETASGWQQVNFATPVAIAPNVTYVVSYFAPQGGYAATSGFFTTAYTSGGFLQAPAGANGLYLYTGGASLFPNQSWNSTNYWVDIVFTPTQ